MEHHLQHLQSLTDNIVKDGGTQENPLTMRVGRRPYTPHLRENHPTSPRFFAQTRGRGFNNEEGGEMGKLDDIDYL